MLSNSNYRFNLTFLIKKRKVPIQLEEKESILTSEKVHSHNVSFVKQHTRFL